MSSPKTADCGGNRCLPSADPWNRAASWLAAWDSQGNHRTATDGDDAGAEWLAAEAASLGADVAIEEFAVERLDPVAAFLDIDGERIPAIPAFDAPSTDRDGIGGRLGPVGSDAEIAVAELPPQAVYSGEYERLRRDAAHRGFVILCAGQSPGMALLNAERFRDAVRHADDPSVEHGARHRARGRGASTARPGSSPRAAGRQLPPATSSSRSMPPDAAAAVAARRDDPAQLVVAIDRRARRRHRVLARNAAGAAGGEAVSSGRVHRE